MKFSGYVDNWPMNKWLNFGGDSDHESRYGSGYVPDPDPDRDTGKLALAEVCTVPGRNRKIPRTKSKNTNTDF